jgi:hypothetical protein
VDVVEIRFPSGRGAEEIVPRTAADLAWMANLGCLELHPHPVRADDLDHPDELRVDLDPVPGVTWKQLQQVAGVVREALADFGMTGWPKTSGKRGLHVNVRIKREWTFDEVRRAALALAREVERRVPKLARSGFGPVSEQLRQNSADYSSGFRLCTKQKRRNVVLRRVLVEPVMYIGNAHRRTIWSTRLREGTRPRESRGERDQYQQQHPHACMLGHRRRSASPRGVPVASPSRRLDASRGAADDHAFLHA